MDGKDMEKKVKRFGLAVVALIAIVILQGSALTQPPVDLRCVRFTAAGTPLTTADTDINFLSLNKGPCCSFTVVNDNAGGGADILVCVSNGVTTAAAGADGAITTSIPVKAAESQNFDGRFTHATLRSGSGNSAARILISFDR